jgi:hypothetical protein
MKRTTQDVCGPLRLQFDGLNRDLVERVERMLGEAVAKPDRHGRWLNTLAMLEHIGCRKIVTSPCSEPNSAVTLKHILEEARHAFFLKHQAEKLSGGAPAHDDGALAAPAAARMYFQRLDATVSRSTPGPAVSGNPYLCVSVIVEFRATWMYALYESVLKRAGSALSMRSLIGEETVHLDDLLRRLLVSDGFDTSSFGRLFISERKFFVRFLEALELHGSTPAPGEAAVTAMAS